MPLHASHFPRYFFVVYQLSLHGTKFNLNKPSTGTQNHKRMHDNLVKNINVITNLIDVSLTTNHFHYIGIPYHRLRF